VIIISKKCAVYIRVSTSKQELENQKIILTEFAEKSKWEIFDFYCDVISGKEDKRPQYDRLFEDAHKLCFEVVLFWDLSRFSRAGMEFTVLKLNELSKLGIFFHSFQEPLLNTDNELVRNIIIAVMSSLAKIQREKISDNTKLAFTKDENGRTIARKSGKHVGRSSLPDEVVQQIIELLHAGKSFNYIHDHVTYKAKHGKIKHVSKGKISEIKNSVQKTGV